MKTTEIKLYDFAELSEQAQEKALQDWVSSQDLEFEGEMVQENFREYLQSKGIDAENVYFSLGHCQGDGVSFTGEIDFDHEEWKETIKEIEAISGSYCLNCKIKQEGFYYHENTMSLDFDLEFYDENDDEILEYDEKGYEANPHEDFIEDLEAEILEEIRDYAIELKNQGYAEFDYYTSPEYFAEMADCNEWQFLEDGTMF